MRLHLFMTQHCHLCELAIEELKIVRETTHPLLEWEVIDIAYDDALAHQYETTIPVLKRIDKTAQLLWPFSAQHIIDFVCE